MVGASPELMRLAVTLVMRAAMPLMLAAPAPWAFAATETYVVTGNCRDGQPHGAYELRTQGGTLRVAGAFTRGKRTGSFLFWSASGARVALLPFENDVMNGTVALWYLADSPKIEPRSRLEAVYVDGRQAGGARSWYPDGRQRAEFRYDQGVLAEARAWSATGALLPEAEARAMAARDKAADEQFYTTLEAMVRANPPQCEVNGRKP